MKNWTRFFYQPCMPLGRDGKRVTGSTEHIALSREAAAEGMVLLKNEGSILPLKKGQKVALFGKGCADYVKGGGGSGDVTTAYKRSLLDGLRRKQQEGKAVIFEPLAAYYEKEVAAQYAQGIVPGMTAEPEVPEELMRGAAAFTDTAVITICRFSGENWDRTITQEGNSPHVTEFQEDVRGLLGRSAKIFERGDFYLSKAEERLVERVKERFAKVAVVLNVGGVVDTSWFCTDERIQAALIAWQGGMEGGLAAADLLCADAVPSGHLTDTFASRLEDYPSSANFHESDRYVEYTEDIYVGYRYFETLPGAASKVNYPFGFGLSYTEFLVKPETAAVNRQDGICVLASVTNVGAYAGKETVQLYAGAPQGRLGKPARTLIAFAKTRLLQPGETQTVKLAASFETLVSYDDLGKVRKSAYVLEKGSYEFYLGTSVRDAVRLADASFHMDEDEVVSQLSALCVPNMLKERLRADGTMEALTVNEAAVNISQWDREQTKPLKPDVAARKGTVPWESPAHRMLAEVAEGSCTMDEFMAQLSVDDLISLVCGQPNTGVANTYGFGNLPEYGVPNVMTADGPAGVRVLPECGVETTAFPCATLLACTWNPALVERVGAAGAEELIENNLGVWLTPGMNIHRSPLCGRNFEYYSEDPLVTGKMAAAMVRGIQSRGAAASAKHFVCNNKETSRVESDSRVSERALREIYLKGFEIAVKESQPHTIMTSYNILNGRRTSENSELISGILRGEWGFSGMVTTDWWCHGEQYLEIKAGNDVKMGCGYPERLKQAYADGKVSKEELRACAERVLELILKLA